MLILTRKNQESILIGHTVKIKILGVNDYQVLLGIDAPKVIPVHRHEVYERIYQKIATQYVPSREKRLFLRTPFTNLKNNKEKTIS